MNPDEQKNHWQPDIDEPETPGVATMEQPEQTPSQKVDSVEQPPVNWTASEYIHFEKGRVWYLVFAVVVLCLVAVDVFLLRSWTFSALVIVMAVAVVVYARRPPREIQYALSGKQGLYIGEKLYNLADYKAFGIIRDGDHHSIMLIPTKRFSPGVSVYFPEESGEKIVDILGARLPMEELKLDAIDLIVRQLRL